MTSKNREVDNNFLSAEEVEKATGIPASFWDRWLQTGLEIEGAELWFNQDRDLEFSLTPASAVGNKMPLAVVLLALRVGTTASLTDIKKCLNTLFPEKTTLTMGEFVLALSLMQSPDAC